MDITPDHIQQGASAAKAFFDAAKAAVGFLKQAREALPSSKEREEADRALAEAEQAAKIAEAQLALAFGYQLCRQHFPPVVMLEVGYLRDGKRVFGCPVCRNDTAKPYSFTRTAP